MVDHAALATALDGLADLVSGEFSVEDALRRLAVVTASVLPVDGVGVMAAGATSGGAAGGVRFVHATTEDVRVLERLQEDTQSGPCVDSLARAQPLVCDDVVVDGGWPAFQVTSGHLGLHTVAALPLRARGRSWGVLDLYACERAALAPADLAAAGTLAKVACSYVVMAADREESRAAQEALAQRAMHDPLTELPVRWVFLEQLTHALAWLPRRPGQVGVLFVDLDGLKHVNDTYGHTAGDALIRHCAERLREAVRPTDVVARIGGDEFVALLEGIHGVDDAREVATRVLARLAAPGWPPEVVVRPSASIGIAVTADGAVGADALVTRADRAMYRAKQAGRGRSEVYDATSAADTARDELLVDLRAALRAQDQLAVHFQPVVDLRSGATAGVEALLRWHHPVRGLLPAGAFLDAAEDGGLLPELDAWGVRAACGQLAAWDAELGPRAPRRLFLNVSTPELEREETVLALASAVVEHAVDPARLVLEISERGALSTRRDVVDVVAGLRRLGCELAIDDFGTGHSSLRRLLQVPAAVIKVDQSFTKALTTSEESVAVLSAVLHLGSRLRREVVVEGVEDAASAALLLELGCRYAQGFHLGVPAAADDLQLELPAA